GMSWLFTPKMRRALGGFPDGIGQLRSKSKQLLSAAHETAEWGIAPANTTLGGRKQGVVIFKNMKVVDCEKLARFMLITIVEDAGDIERGRGDGLSGLGRRSPRCAFRDTRPSNQNYSIPWDSSSFYFSF
ncbi:hypothetical protein, partial [Salinibacter ruber]|uniref:hypothetical protein n=1 Tax=Salinibacter ruber TaxID=146919 RepID=UPI002168A80C